MRRIVAASVAALATVAIVSAGNPAQAAAGPFGHTATGTVFNPNPVQELGLEIPRFTWFDGVGFLAAWVLVGGLIGLLVWLSGLR